MKQTKKLTLSVFRDTRYFRHGTLSINLIRVLCVRQFTFYGQNDHSPTPPLRPPTNLDLTVFGGLWGGVVIYLPRNKYYSVRVCVCVCVCGGVCGCVCVCVCVCVFVHVLCVLVHVLCPQRSQSIPPPTPHTSILL